MVLKTICSDMLMYEVLKVAVENLAVGNAPSTVDGLYKKMNVLCKCYGSLSVADMTPNMWLRHEKDIFSRYGYKSLQQFVQINNEVVRLLVNDGFLQGNPLTTNKLKNVKKLRKKAPDVFTLNEIQKLLSQNVSRSSEVLLVKFGLMTGLRIGELLALNAESYDKEEGTYFVDLSLSTSIYKAVKTERSNRAVELCEGAVEALEELIELAHGRGESTIEVLLEDNKTTELQKRTLLAFNETRQQIYQKVDNFSRDFFKEHCKVSGVRYIKPMNLRHTYASQLITQGVPLIYVANQMGHTEKELTEKCYTAWIKEDAEKTYQKIDEHFKQYTFDTSVEAANDEIFNKKEQGNKKGIFSWFTNLFTKKAS